ncbi:hypothetical protein ACB098_01G026700 [Castanea mollissima]|uniref:BHLH domain-containing protein n=1 Tax=Castanea mollissima TaxID=60419 RepID=A0A8J4QIU2_9ROSI|nr:hypothetical protein CMV_023799 [Castanea mollissima]
MDHMEQLKSSEDQMEMMMMLEMDKLPEFCGAYNDVNELQPQEFSGPSSTSNNNNISTMSHYMNNPQIASPPSPLFLNIPSTSTNPIQQASTPSFLSGARAVSTATQKRNSMAAMREMIFRIAAMQPIHIDPESVKPPKRRNVKISKDPQSVAARHRRERISEKIRILQRLVPGGTKMDTASMLDEAIHYVKFLKSQVQSLERAAANRPTEIGFPVAMSSGSSSSYLPMAKGYQAPHAQNVQPYEDA